MAGLRRSGGKWILWALVGFVGAGICAVPAAANDEIATLEAAGGRVTVIRLGQAQPLSPSMPLQLNDIVVTKQGRATVRFHSDGTVLRIGPDSRVQIDESAKERDITVFFGRLWAHVVRWKERPTRFLSGSTIAAIRGTEMSLAVAVDGDETRLSVLEGRVLAENDAGSLPLARRADGGGRKGKAPALERPGAAAGRGAAGRSTTCRSSPSSPASWRRDRAGRPRSGNRPRPTRRAISSGPSTAWRASRAEDIRDPRFFTYRASLLLAAGSVEEAGKDIERALGLAPNDSRRARSADDRGRREQPGRQGARDRPRGRSPPIRSSATAQIALSYARQAKFDLEGRPGEPRDRGAARARRRAGVGAAGGDPLLARIPGARRSRRPRRRSLCSRTWPGPRRSWDSPI